MSDPRNIITNITPPRAPLTDDRTGLISREWYRFFLSLFTLTGSGQNFTSLTDLQVGPPPVQIAELQKQINGVMTQPRPELGTMSQLQQSWLPWVTWDTAPEITPTAVGTMAWDGGTTLGLQMTANVLGRINESGYCYIKASSAITKGQVIMFTGSVGASGVPTGAPATGVTDGTYIMGVAAENIANNGFGLIQFLGTLRGVDTSAFADGDVLWYNPAVTGGFTKTKPSAPNVKVQMAAVISATNNGTILIRVNAGSVLGGTDSNVQFGTLADKDFIQYDSALQYWKNVAPGALTKTDDTNVTLTLGGTPSMALLAATSLTLGWTGQLSVARGGTGLSTTPTNGQLLIGNGTGYTVANLTAGTNISISNTAGGITISSSNPGGTVTSVNASGGTTGMTFTGGPITSSGTLTLGGTLAIANGGTGVSVAGITAFNNITGYTASGATGTTSTNLVFSTSPSITTPTLVGNATLSTGNLVQGAAAKGFNFSANTAQAGMTSRLLNWYEEGTWTPNQGGGLTVVGAFSSQGKYTRVGRQVTIIGSVSGATSIAVNANSQISTNLPFATGVFALGSAINNAATAFSTTYVATSIIYSASAIGATTTISFQITYFV